eukprot:401925-Prymnesium_polylepis.1
MQAEAVRAAAEHALAEKLAAAETQAVAEVKAAEEAQERAVAQALRLAGAARATAARAVANAVVAAKRQAAAATAGVAVPPAVAESEAVANGTSACEVMLPPRAALDLLPPEPTIPLPLPPTIPVPAPPFIPPPVPQHLDEHSAKSDGLPPSTAAACCTVGGGETDINGMLGAVGVATTVVAVQTDTVEPSEELNELRERYAAMRCAACLNTPNASKPLWTPAVRVGLRT